ncbi:MAG: putative transcriptional regulatory protein YrbC [Candidatus Tyloplasma litorale]|nr:MAG: putative transcriptional regulatory protein YrbC [Mycoplasmatales bacterium]
MAGHSKWANIKHKKGAQDAKRGKIFQKITKEIEIAIKQGGTDPETNPRLRLSIEKAKSVNMPNDNISRALSKANKDTSNWNEITYEGYGPGGVAVLVNCLTDNVNRTAASIKSDFNKGNGNLGTNGSVSYLFENKGIIVIDSEKFNIDDIMEIILEAEVIDIKEEDEFIIIETDPSKFIETKEFLEKNNINEFVSSEVTKVASTTIEIDEATQEKLNKLIDKLEDNDDVQDVYTNVK